MQNLTIALFATLWGAIYLANRLAHPLGTFENGRLIPASLIADLNARRVTTITTNGGRHVS